MPKPVSRMANVRADFQDTATSLLPTGGIIISTSSISASPAAVTGPAISTSPSIGEVTDPTSSTFQSAAATGPAICTSPSPAAVTGPAISTSPLAAGLTGTTTSASPTAVTGPTSSPSPVAVTGPTITPSPVAVTGPTISPSPVAVTNPAISTSPSPAAVTNPTISTDDGGATWSNVSGDSEEEKIKLCIETNKSLIVQLVQPKDLLVYLSTYFTMAQRAEIIETAKSDKQVATRKAIEIYLHELTDLGRFTAFREAISKGYPNVEKLLSSRERPLDRSSDCKKLNKVRNKIVQQLDPLEILPYLLNGLILQHEAERIHAEANNHGKMAASRRLLHYIPRHVDDWLPRFCDALRECDQSNVAELLEDENSDYSDDETMDSVSENLKLYLPYIAECVKLDHMQAFIETMCPGKLTISSTSEGLQILLHGLKNPGRFTAFVDEMRTIGYTLVVDLLLGQYEPWREHYERIVALFTVPLGEQIDLAELLPHLLRYGVLQEDKAEEIHQKERNEGKTNAAWLFLMIDLPRSRRNWFRPFMKALVDCGRGDIARELDDLMYEKITAESRSGYGANAINAQNSGSSSPLAGESGHVDGVDICTGDAYNTYPYGSKAPNPQFPVAPYLKHSQNNDGICASDEGYNPAIASSRDSSHLVTAEVTRTPNTEDYDVSNMEHGTGAEVHTPDFISEQSLGARPKTTCTAKQRIPMKRVDPWRVESIPSEMLEPTVTGAEDIAGLTLKDSTDDPLKKLADIEQDLETNTPLNADATCARDVLNLMDCAGYSEMQRTEWQTHVREDEIYRTVIQKISQSDFTILWQTNLTLYDVYQICLDGTQNRRLNLMYCDETLKLCNSPKICYNGLYLSMIKDENTCPDEVKLQAIVDGTPITVKNFEQEARVSMTADGSGKVCFKPHEIKRDRKCNENIVKSKSYSFRCPVWSFPIELLNSRDHLVRIGVDMKQVECFAFSTKFHEPESDQIIWNVSFVTMEKHLLDSLDPVQHKCLMILEIVMEHLSTRLITEDMHFQWNSRVTRSCLFYLVENSESDQWHEQNIIQCVLICLLQLMRWMKDGSCPDYFIPDVNLLPLMPEQRMKLLDQMCAFVTTGYQTFFTPASIYTANSEVLESAPCLQNILAPVASCMKRAKRQMCASTISNIMSFDSTLRDMLGAVNKDQKMQYLQCCIDILEKQSSCNVLSNLRPVIHLHQAEALLSEMNAMEAEILRCFRLGCHDVLVSSILTYALALYSFGYKAESKSQLRKARERLNHAVPVCFCLPGDRPGLLVEETSDAADRSSSVAQCVRFQPEHIRIAPDPIQMEMCESNDIAVDAVIFLQFLEYLVFKRDRDRRRIAIAYFESAMMDSEALKHPVIAYNLLGWVYLQENEIEKAKQCFNESLKIKPNHNVSSIHLQNVG